MEQTTRTIWNPVLADPTGRREHKARLTGQTMVIDKGLGVRAFEDMLRISSPYIDYIKLGFGTSVLYPIQVLQEKVQLAKEQQIFIMPGGTLLEVAVARNAVDSFFEMVNTIGFTAIEVSDGTIDLGRNLRSSLIIKAIDCGLTVVTEHGKKMRGSTIELKELEETVQIDTELGAKFVTIEARESGIDVGIFDEQGKCREDTLQRINEAIKDKAKLMWEAPLKSQQANLLQQIGPDLNIGNVAPEDVLSLEALRRGLRSDTFHLGITTFV